MMYIKYNVNKVVFFLNENSNINLYLYIERKHVLYLHPLGE